MNTTFTITVNKVKVEMELTIDKYDFWVNCRNNELEWIGSVCQGNYNYNKTDLIFWELQKEFKFFEENIRTQIKKIAKKNKFIK